MASKTITFIPIAVGASSQLEVVEEELKLGERVSEYISKSYEKFFSKFIKKAGSDLFELTKEDAKVKIDELVKTAVDQACDIKYIIIGGVLVLVVMAGSVIYLLHHSRDLLKKQAEDTEIPKFKKVKKVVSEDGAVYVKEEKISKEDFEELMKKVGGEAVVDDTADAAQDY